MRRLSTSVVILAVGLLSACRPPETPREGGVWSQRQYDSGMGGCESMLNTKKDAMEEGKIKDACACYVTLMESYVPFEKINEIEAKYNGAQGEQAYNALFTDPATMSEFENKASEQCIAPHIKQSVTLNPEFAPQRQQALQEQTQAQHAQALSGNAPQQHSTPPDPQFAPTDTQPVQQKKANRSVRFNKETGKWEN